jgi:hypothetical protein
MVRDGVRILKNTRFLQGRNKRENGVEIIVEGPEGKEHLKA